MAVSRARNFATVVYPESAPENWLDLLRDQFIPAFISPLHDRDVDPLDQVKKSHYHVILMFDGVKSDDQVREIFDLIGGVGLERVKSIRGYARYLCHLDNPEKYQYRVDEVVALCGADYADTIALAIDDFNAIGEMMDYCAAEQIYSFARLCLYARANRPDWFRVLSRSATIIMSQFLKSLYWDAHNLDSL